MKEANEAQEVKEVKEKRKRRLILGLRALLVCTDD
jgi:hypothetical protein